MKFQRSTDALIVDELTGSSVYYWRCTSKKKEFKKI